MAKPSKPRPSPRRKTAAKPAPKPRRLPRYAESGAVPSRVSVPLREFVRLVDDARALSDRLLSLMAESQVAS